jgi:large subunit ribosomal protein L21
MYAIVKSGGKQLKVTVGDVVQVEKLAADVGGSVTLSHVLMLVDGTKTTIGTPVVAGAKVVGQVTAQGRAEKVIIFKKKRRQNYRRKKGHKQPLTTLTITAISAS